MNKYQNAKIYKIVDVYYKKCYIASTCESLSQRMARHRRHYRFYQNNPKRSMTSFYLFDDVGIDNCKIELIESYPCQSKEELLKREGYHIQNNDCVNRCIAGRTPKEYKEYYNPLNQEKIKQGFKNWYDENKDEWKQKVKPYREENKDIIKEKAKEKTICLCGAIVCKYKLQRHYESNKHQNYIANILK